MNAILKYPGGKWRIADWIISHFPPHKVYLEPYFGSGAIFFKKEPSYIETVNDINGEIVNFFRVCRDYPEEFAKVANLTPFAREEFQFCYDPAEDPIERARRVLVRYHQSFGTCNCSKKTWKNVKTYGGPRCATMWNNLPDVIISCGERLKNAQIENTNAISLIERYNDPNTLIYCDPPYLNKLRKKNMYADEMSDFDHVVLLETIAKSRANVIISGYDNELYNSVLCGWSSDMKETVIQMGLHRTEKIWFNF